jgi:DNA invertase Pin-like site-specific DNA recombinase
MKNIVFGYARVSSRDQNEGRQIEQLKADGISENNIIIDKQSGKNFVRTGYQYLINNRLSEGDVLVITSIDRLGRNYQEIVEQWKRITQKINADIKVLDMPLLDTTKSGESLDSRFVADLVLQILSYVANKERDNTRSRQRQGIDIMPIVNGKRISVKTGRPVGRPAAEYPAQWDLVYKDWENGQIAAKKAMSILGLKPNTFYKLVKDYKAISLQKS